jgi:pimeloyl-ACP methyl ester carboxylesterase
MPSDGPLIFSETFGKKDHPAVLLNAGAGNQSIIWPARFCKDLAAKGYFVIRYDYRDTGLSDEIDYEKNPYNALDLAKDALTILKKYDIKKATFVGYSMGGQVSLVAAAHFPASVQNVILIASSSNFKPGFEALEGKLVTEKPSPPHPDYVKFIHSMPDFSKLSLEQKVDVYVDMWRSLDGNPENFDEEFAREQAREGYARTKLQNPYAVHSRSMKASYELHREAPALVKAPTLIIQGDKDPVFPVDHGEDLREKIKNSQLLVLKNFGHAISPRNFGRLVEAIDSFIRKKR